MLIHNAKIMTIHSFCLYLMKNHFNDIGLDPDFRTADEGEIRLLKQEVLSELLEEQFALGRQEFTDCVEYFAYDGREKTAGRADRTVIYLFPEAILFRKNGCGSTAWIITWRRLRSL